MPRYIDADALKDSFKESYERLNELHDEAPSEGFKEIIRSQMIVFMEAILRTEEAPTADVAPVVHGRWDEKQIVLEWCEDDVDIFYTCSACGAASPSETFYCPNCGAKMDGEKRNDV